MSDTLSQIRGQAEQTCEFRGAPNGVVVQRNTGSEWMPDIERARETHRQNRLERMGQTEMALGGGAVMTRRLSGAERALASEAAAFATEVERLLLSQGWSDPDYASGFLDGMRAAGAVQFGLDRADHVVAVGERLARLRSARGGAT